MIDVGALPIWLEQTGGTSVPAVPTVLGIAPSSGSTAGSTHVVIHVNASAGCISAAIDGVDLTGFGADDSTHVSGDTVAHGAGAVDVTVTNGVGTSAPLVGGYTYAAPSFDVTSYPWSGLWYADGTNYAGAPWTPVASAGTSGSNGDLVGESVAPTTGTPQGGFTPAEFNGSTHGLVSQAALITDLITVADFTIVAVVKANTAVATGGVYYVDPALITDVTGGNFAVTYTTSGWLAALYNGGPVPTTPIAQATGSYAFVVARLDSGSGLLKIRVSSVEHTVSSPAIATLAANGAVIGAPYNVTSNRLACDLLLLATAKTAFSDADIDALQAGLSTLFAVTL